MAKWCHGYPVFLSCVKIQRWRPAAKKRSCNYRDNASDDVGDASPALNKSADWHEEKDHSWSVLMR